MPEIHGSYANLNAVALARMPRADRQGERLPYLAFLIFIFIVLATGSAAKYPWNYIVKVSGIVLVLAYAIRSLMARTSLSPEVLLYLGWIMWSMTGLIAGANLTIYRVGLVTVFQIWVLLAVIAGYTNCRRVLSFNLFAFLVGSFIVWFSGVATGSFGEALVTDVRATGMSMDPNGFGWLMIVATVTMAYFWMLPSRLGPAKYVLLAMGMTGAGAATILSGSRFAIVGMTLFYLFWIWLCYRREIFKRPSVLAMVLLGLALGVSGFAYLAGRTVAGERLQKTWRRLSGQVTEGGDAGRIAIYKDALSVVGQHPVFGVGLNNYRLHSPGLTVAHSEYTEIAADTGVPGFVIYFAIYLILWRRAGKIAKHSPDPYAVKTARLMRAYLITMLLIGLGTTHYYNKTAWIIMGAFVGYSHTLWRQIRAQPVELQTIQAYQVQSA